MKNFCCYLWKKFEDYLLLFWFSKMKHLKECGFEYVYAPDIWHQKLLFLYFFHRSPLERFDLLSHNCLSFFADTTSLHGPKWYNLMPNYFCRFILGAFIIIFLVTFTIYFYQEIVAIENSNSCTTTIEWEQETHIKYPNLTVCFAKFFDSRRMKGKTINKTGLRPVSRLL